MATDVKNQIAETFERHAKRVGIDKVTINAIVTECKISRQAFYYYYQDIVDVARYIMKEKLQLTQKTCEETEDPEKAVKNFANEFVKQFPVISMTLNSKLRGEMEILLIGELKEFFLSVINRHNCGRDLNRKQVYFHADLIACGLTGFAVEHCNESNFDAVAFADLLWDLIRRTYGED